MTSNITGRRWIAALRSAFPWFAVERRRYVASIKTPTATTSKLTPIEKVVADAGRNSATPAD